ncbi:MAG: hypothetical protein KGY76_03300 [Candidatus Thermoplasmatota archaeon]|nr:hypothetical protein [Candidatus Thermoplasmatota archaeon]
MSSQMEQILSKRVGNLAPTVIQIEKKKLGLTGEEIPEDIKEDFIQGVICVCQNEVQIDVDRNLKEELESSVD